MSTRGEAQARPARITVGGMLMATFWASVLLTAAMRLADAQSASRPTLATVAAMTGGIASLGAAVVALRGGTATDQLRVLWTASLTTGSAFLAMSVLKLVG